MSCSIGSANEDEIRASEVYDEVVRWLVDDAGGGNAEDPMAVFIEPRGEGAAISLDVQAELIEATKDVADVRFLDERSEGLVDEDGTVVVKDEGILIRLGPVVEDDSHVLLDVDIWESDRHVPTRCASSCVAAGTRGPCRARRRTIET